jgi:hypothetical protein
MTAATSASSRCWAIPSATAHIARVEQQLQRDADALGEHLTRVKGGERGRTLDRVEMTLRGDDLATLAGILGRSGRRENRPAWDRLEATKAG